MLSDAARDRIETRVSPDDGVPFRYNDLTALNLQPLLPFFNELEQEHFPDQSFMPVDGGFSSRAVDPSLVLQANFIQGGVLLALSPHHSTSDMAGWTTFSTELGKAHGDSGKRDEGPSRSTYRPPRPVATVQHLTKTCTLKILNRLSELTPSLGAEPGAIFWRGKVQL